MRLLIATLGAASLFACAGMPRGRPGSAIVATADGGSRVSGASGLYSLALPSAEWRVEAARPDGADLVIFGPARDLFVLVHTIADATTTLDDVVDHRRETVRQKWGAQPVHEKRYFLDAMGYVPASMAQYSTGTVGAGRGVVVLTVRAAALIEVLGFTPAFETHGAALDAVLRSFALSEQGGERRD